MTASRSSHAPCLHRRTRSGRSIAHSALPPIALAVIGVLAWWLAARVTNSSVFPPPDTAVTSLIDNLGRSEFRDSLTSSLRLLTESYLCAALIGAATGLVIGLSRFWTDALAPLLHAFNSLPKIVLYPVFLIFLGIGDPSRMAFAFVSGFIPMTLVVLEGAAGTKLVQFKLAASLGLTYPALIRKIILPSMVPTQATAARLTFGLTFLGLLLAEMFSGSGGLGYELLQNITLVRLQDILGEVLLIAVISLLPTLALRWVEIRMRARFEP